MPKVSNHRKAEKKGEDEVVRLSGGSMELVDEPPKTILASVASSLHTLPGASSSTTSTRRSVPSSSELPLSTGGASIPSSGALKPSFPSLSTSGRSVPLKEADESRIIRVPSNRYTPLRENWDALVAPIVDNLKLLIRMNTKQRAIEIKNSPFTTDPGALQKGQDFLKAFILGFEVPDAVALLRLDDLFVESFEVTDVKPLKGDHLSRAIGRIAGQGGKTKFAIENATRTRVVVADQKVHILGAFSNIQVCRDAICSLILGSPPGKVYNAMKGISARMSGR